MKQKLHVLTQMGHLAHSARFQSLTLLQKELYTAKHAKLVLSEVEVSAKDFEEQANSSLQLCK
jgi:hypothetical protein